MRRKIDKMVRENFLKYAEKIFDFYMKPSHKTNLILEKYKTQGRERGDRQIC